MYGHTLENDLTYVAFMIEKDGKLITNLLTHGGDENTLHLTTDEDSINAIVEIYYGGDIDGFYEAVEARYKKYDDFIEYRDASEEDREKIELMLHKMIIDQSEEKDAMLSISHNDQESLYHIHRIYEKN